MKVIDLLNRIANGEEVPRKVKHKTLYWEYNEKNKDFKDNEDDWVFSCSNYDLVNMLNDEVKIIEEDKEPTFNKIREQYGLPRVEEDKKIEHLDIYNCFKVMGIDKTGRLDENFTDISNKINEIIDYINGGINGE